MEAGDALLQDTWAAAVPGAAARFVYFLRVWVWVVFVRVWVVSA